MKITLPDGSVREYPGPVTPAQVAADIGPGLAKAAIGAKVNGELRDLNRVIESDSTLAIITRPKPPKQPGSAAGKPAQVPAAPPARDHGSPDALHLLRHSAAHVMAQAICKLYPRTLLAYGPALDNGFYYDLALDTPISTDDFPKIEEEMRAIVQANLPFTRVEKPVAEGMQLLEAEGNKYKIDNARRAVEGGAKALSWYVTGLPGDGAQKHFEDLCTGPHVPGTGVIGAFKLTNIASSHWHGDVNSDRFQRIYGTAFFTPEDLATHLAQAEEARQRDHRVIGQKLGLFTLDEMVGPGLVLWKPRGGMVRMLLEDFLRKKLLEVGYSMVYTPHIGKVDLYKTSGHYPYYADSQYPTIKMKDHPSSSAADTEEYLLKPMNCPHHCRIYASEPRSYRDLPVRLAEFGTVYRFEQSGELTGMTRVRGFTQDDAHLFCTQDQVQGEVQATLGLVRFVLSTFGFNKVDVRLSLRDPGAAKYVGDPAVWDRAERELREVLAGTGLSFTEAQGEAAFYGPKVDFVVRDVIGRPWQLGTVQLDYNLPQRFQLEYIGRDNQTHRPVMVHRAPFGALERFMAILIEHYGGAFPLWLSPEQVRVLPVSDKFAGYARQVLEALVAAGLRTTLDESGDRVQAKIKVAQDLKVSYMLVVGGRDEQAGTVSVRCRSRGDLGALTLPAFIAQAQRETATFGAETVRVS